MKRGRVLLGFSILLLTPLVWLAATLFSPERDVRYTITDLDTLGGIYSYALELNDKGHIAGVRLVSATDQRLFLWTPEDGMVDVPAFGKSVGVNAMNESDEMVGYCFTPSRKKHAFYWKPFQAMVDLGTLGGIDSEALGMNNRGEVVGYSSLDGGGSTGFVWSATNGMEPVDLYTQDLNEAGQILCSTGGLQRTFYVVERDSREESSAKGLKGDLKCFIHNIRTKDGGSIWTRIPFVDMQKEFPIEVERGHTLHLHDWNQNQIVGETSYYIPWLETLQQRVGLNDLFDRGNEAIVWEGTETINLTTAISPESGWDVLLCARSINKEGQIAGYGEIGGETHAFLLTPIEERSNNGRPK